jgi:hypothetical protein
MQKKKKERKKEKVEYHWITALEVTHLSTDSTPTSLWP